LGGASPSAPGRFSISALVCIALVLGLSSSSTNWGRETSNDLFGLFSVDFRLGGRAADAAGLVVVCGVSGTTGLIGSAGGGDATYTGSGPTPAPAVAHLLMGAFVI
jgi:hypothetical protein